MLDLLEIEIVELTPEARAIKFTRIAEQEGRKAEGLNENSLTSENPHINQKKKQR